MKRIAISLAVFLVGLGIGSSLATIASSSDNPEAYNLGTPKRGDQVEYSLYYKDQGQEQSGTLWLRWLPPEYLLFPDGTEKLVNVLETTQKLDELRISKEFYDPATNQVIGAEYVIDSGFGDRAMVSGPLVGDGLVTQKYQNFVQTRENFDSRPGCLPNFSGSTKPGDAMKLTCGWTMNKLLTTADGLRYANGSMEVHFTPDVPYPSYVNAETKIQQGFLELDIQWRVELQGFTKGDSQLLESALLTQAVDVTTQIPEPWLISDTETTQIFAEDVDAFLRTTQLVSGTDKMVGLYRGDYNTGGVNENYWNAHYDSGMELNVISKTIPGLVDQHVFALQSQRQSGFSPVSIAAPTMDSLTALWEHHTSTPAEFNWASIYPSCTKYIGDHCELEFYEIRLRHGVVDSVPFAVYNQTSSGFTWTPMYLSFTTSKVSLFNAHVYQVSPYDANDNEATHSNKQPTRASSIGAAGAGIGALAGILYFFKPSILGLFSREMKDPLEHPARASIMQAIEKSPGIHFQNIRKSTGLAAGTTQHHLRMLEAQKCILRQEALGKTCFFPKSRMSARERLMRIAHQDKQLHAILTCIDGSEKTMTSLASELGISASTANHHANRLMDLGLLTRTKRGRTTFVALA